MLTTLNGRASLALFLVAYSLSAANPAHAQQTAEPHSGLKKAALDQIAALQEEKAIRTSSQRKLSSSLFYLAKMARGEAVAQGVPRLRLDVQTRISGNSLVVIQGDITPRLVKTIRQVGGELFGVYPNQGVVDAAVDVRWLEYLATLPEVRFIGVPPRVTSDAGSVTSGGDFRHGANVARAQYGVSGAGLRIGVLSDSVNNNGQLDRGIASGDIPPLAPANEPLPAGSHSVVVQDLTPTADLTGRDEGEAMMEIIHDLAPDASLFFATAFISDASFAQNIRDLRNIFGCDILVDDIRYSSESPFQDSPIARAVNEVTAGGALYFASAGNSGSLRAGNAASWEGDFSDGGPASTLPLQGVPNSAKTLAGTLHQFSPAQPWNQFYNASSYVELFWSDPLGGSANDYDLIVTNSDGTAVLSASTNVQDGSQNPFEETSARVEPGSRLYVVKSAEAAPRYLRLTAFDRRPLQFYTGGSTYGHSSARDAFAIAATYAGGDDQSVFTSAADLESFSADGPRRMFFDENGVPYTPGNFSSTGGVLRLKPDLTAADAVATNNVTFPVFFGTSAAAPHAAAIAALVRSYNPLLTASEMRIVLTKSAVDLRTPGWDEGSGYGIVMPLAAIQFVEDFLVPGAIKLDSFTSSSAVISWKTTLPSSSRVDFGTTGSYGETATIDEAATSHSVTLSGLSPSTTYHYRVASATGTNSVSKASGDLTFATAAVPGATANIIVSKAALTRNQAGTLTATITLQNTSSGAGLNTVVTSASLGASSTTTPLSYFVGTVPANGTATVTLAFPPAPAGRGQLQVQGSFNGGYFSASTRVVIPN